MNDRPSERSYLIMLALADGQLHGYALMGRVADLSGGSITVGPGSLYTNLDRLVAQGLVQASGEAVVDGRNRRYYRLTDAGYGAVDLETARLSALAHKARRIVTRVAASGA